MGHAAVIATSLRLAKRGLALLAALCFVLSGMASIHTAHALALAGGHDAAHAMPAATADAHCDLQSQPDPDARQAGSINLHRSLGFAMIGTFPAIGFKFGRWIDSVLMQKPLGEGQSTLPQ